MKSTGHNAKFPFTSKTGLFATLGGSLRAKGTRAPSAPRARLAQAVLLVVVVACLAPSSVFASPAHEYKSSFGPDCTGSTRFENPGAVAVDEETHDIYVADQGRGVFSVIKCTASGEEAIFTAGPGAGTNKIAGFSFSYGQGDSQIAVAPTSHDFYVADTFNGVLKAFESNGEEALFTQGSAAGTNQIAGFINVCGVAVDANGYIYVADAVGGADFTGLVDVFAPNGEELTSFATSEPCNLAVDSHGAVYVDHLNTKSVEKFTPSVFPVTAATTYPATGTFVDGGPDYSVAVDPLSDDLYADQRLEAGHSQIAQLDQEGHLLGTFASPGEAGELVASEGVAVDGSTGDVYVSDSEGDGKVRIFVPSPPNPPSVGASSLSDVTATSANLRAQVNPERWDTHYRFQYLTEAEYQANPGAERFAGAAETLEANLGSAGTVQTARAQLSGLKPDTTYLFRVAAENKNNEGSPVFGSVVPGEEGEFHTFPVFASGLSDGRAYELVSPPAKAGEVFVPEPDGALGASCLPPGPRECLPGVLSQMTPMQSAPDGESVVYAGDPFSGGLSSAANEYLAKRGQGGWATQGLSLPLFVNGPQGQGYKAFSPDLSRGVLYQVSPALLPEAPTSHGKSFANLYLRRSDGSLQSLLTGTPPNRSPGFVCDVSCGEFNIIFGGGNSGTASSPAFGHLIFAANDALTGGVAGVSPGAPEVGPFENNLYEWLDGQLRLVNVLPDNEHAAAGAVIGSGRLLISDERETYDFDHAISADGSRVFWSEESGGQVYVRIDGKETEKIEDPGKFLNASADGAKVLLNDGCLYDLQAKTCKDLTVGEGGFQGILGAAEDLSRVYFVDTKVLPGVKENANKENAIEGEKNLYAWHDGAVAFMGALLNVDNGFTLGEKFGDWKASSADRLAQVNPAGTYLAFVSNARLTGYDNDFRGGGECPNSGNVCVEVFEYDANAEKLTCASCNPTGLRPLGKSNLSLIRGWNSPFPQPGNLSADGGGRLFFESQDALSPQDTNGATTDVYEWEPGGVGSCKRAAGCVFLISSGHAANDSFFVDSTPSGSDAFFVTREQLLSGDKNEQLDLYDARVGGGVEGGADAPCGGEACRGSLAGPPAQPGVSSAEFSGPGNLASSTPKPSVKLRSLTRARKLANALKACSKKPKEKRRACRAQARKRYAPIKAKTKSKSHKGGK